MEMCINYGDHRTVVALLDRFDEAPHCIKPAYRLINHVTVYLMLCRATLHSDTSLIRALLGKGPPPKGHPHQRNILDWREILLPTLIHQSFSLNTVVKIACRTEQASTIAALLLGASQAIKKSPVHSLNLSSLGLTEDVLSKCDLQAPDMLNFTTVNLSHNSIEVLFPFPTMSFPALTNFHATDCQLKTVPAELFLLPLLQEIRLTDNFLVELPDLPDGSSTSAVYLYLSYNRLTTIPDSFSAPKLQHLELQCNCLSELPKAVLAMTNLRYLKLSNNPALRVIPFNIRWLQNLEQLVLEGMTIENLPPLYTLPMVLEYFRALSKNIAGVEHFEAVFIGTGTASQTEADLVTAVRSLSTQYGFSVIFSPSPALFLSAVETILKPPQVFVFAINAATLPSQLTTLFKPVLKFLSLLYSKAEIVVASCCKVSEHSPSMSAKRKSELLDKQFMCEVETLSGQFPTCNITPCPVNITISSQLANCDLSHFVKLLRGCNSKIATPIALPRYESVIDRHFHLSTTSSSSKDSLNAQSTKDERKPILYGRMLQESLDSVESDSSLPELNWLLQSLEVQGKLFTLCNRRGIVFDRQWLCDFVLRAVNVVHTNAFVRQGILPEPAQATIFSGLGLGDGLPSVLVMHLMHTGVAFPLNRDTYFVPHTLKDSPEPIPLDNTCSRVISAPILLPGFWNRLLVHLTINADALIKLTPQETSIPPSDTSPPGQVLLQHWACGMVVRRGLDKLCFAVRQEIFADEDAIGIIVPLSVRGMRLLTKLFNIVMSILRNWYPSIWPNVKVWIPCSQCRLDAEPQSHYYPFLHCARKLISKKPLCCPLHKEADVFPLSLLPDLLSEALHGTFGTSFQLTCTAEANTEDTAKLTIPDVSEQNASGMQSDFERQLFMLLELTTLKCPHLAVLQEANLGLPPTFTCNSKEYVPLNSVIEQNGKLQRHLALHILMQAAEGLSVLHTNGIIHRDISSHNILVQISPDGSAVDAKVLGFEHAANALYRDSLRGKCGHHPAPEMSWDKEQYEYDSRVDVYSFAFLAYEILTGMLLDPNGHSKPAVEPLVSTAPLLLTTLHRSWQEEPGKRPYSSDLLHVFLQAQTLLPMKYKIVTGEKKCYPQCTVMSFPLPCSVSKGDGGPVVFYASIDEEGSTHFQRYSSQDLAVQATRDVKTVDVIKRGCMLNKFLFAVHNTETVSVLNMKLTKVVKKLTFPSEVISVDTDGVAKVVFGLNNGQAMVHVMSDTLEEFALQSTLSVFECEAIQLVQCFGDTIFFASQSMLKAFNIHSLNETWRWHVGHVAMIAVPFKPGTNESFGEIWAAQKNSVKLTILFTDDEKPNEIVDCCDCYVEECSLGVKAVYALIAVADVMWVALSKGTVLLLDSTTRIPLTVLHLHSDYADCAGVLSIYPAPTVCVWPHLASAPDSLPYKHPQSSHFTIFSTGIGLNCSVFTERHAKITQSNPVLHHGLYVIAISSMTAREHLQLLEARKRNFLLETFRLCHVNHTGTLLGNPSSTMRRYTEHVVPTFARQVPGPFASISAGGESAHTAINPKSSRSRPLVITSASSLRGTSAVHPIMQPTAHLRKSTFVSDKPAGSIKRSSKVPAIEEMEESKESLMSTELATVIRLEDLMLNSEGSVYAVPAAVTGKVKPVPMPWLKHQTSSDGEEGGDVQESRRRHSSDCTSLNSGQFSAELVEVNRQGTCQELGMAVVINENRSAEVGAYYDLTAAVTTTLLPSAKVTPTGPSGGGPAGGGPARKGPLHQRLKSKKRADTSGSDGSKEVYELMTLPAATGSSSDEEYEKMDSTNILMLKRKLSTQSTTHITQPLQGQQCDGGSGKKQKATPYVNLPAHGSGKHAPPVPAKPKTTKHSYVNFNPESEVGHEEVQAEHGRKLPLRPPHQRPPSRPGSIDASYAMASSKVRSESPVLDKSRRPAPISLEKHQSLELLSQAESPPLSAPPHKGSNAQIFHMGADSSATSVRERHQSREQGAKGSQANPNPSNSKKVPLRPKLSHPILPVSRRSESPGSAYVNIDPSLESIVVADTTDHKTSKSSHPAYVNLSPAQPPPAHMKPIKLYSSQQSRDTDHMGYFKMTLAEDKPNRLILSPAAKEDNRRPRLDSTTAHVKVADAASGELEDTIEQPYKYS